MTTTTHVHASTGTGQHQRNVRVERLDDGAVIVQFDADPPARFTAAQVEAFVAAMRPPVAVKPPAMTTVAAPLPAATRTPKPAAPPSIK